MEACEGATWRRERVPRGGVRGCHVEAQDSYRRARRKLSVLSNMYTLIHGQSLKWTLCSFPMMDAHHGPGTGTAWCLVGRTSYRARPTYFVHEGPTAAVCVKLGALVVVLLLLLGQGILGLGPVRVQVRYLLFHRVQLRLHAGDLRARAHTHQGASRRITRCKPSHASDGSFTRPRVRTEAGVLTSMRRHLHGSSYCGAPHHSMVSITMIDATPSTHSTIVPTPPAIVPTPLPFIVCV